MPNKGDGLFKHAVTQNIQVIFVLLECFDINESKFGPALLDLLSGIPLIIQSAGDRHIMENLVKLVGVLAIGKGLEGVLDQVG